MTQEEVAAVSSCWEWWRDGDGSLLDFRFTPIQVLIPNGDSRPHVIRHAHCGRQGEPTEYTIQPLDRAYLTWDRVTPTRPEAVAAAREFLRKRAEEMLEAFDAKYAG